VDDGGCAGLIHEIDVKVLAGREREARLSVRSDKAEHARRLAVDGEGSGVGRQAKFGGASFRRGKAPGGRKERDRGGYRDARRKDLPTG